MSLKMVNNVDYENTKYSGSCSKVQVSNNISTLNLIGDEVGHSNAFKTQLITAQIHPNIYELQQKCFVGCENLESVLISPSTKQIRPSAFRNCTKLKYVSCFDDPDTSHQLENIGSYAFYNTALKDIKINLRSSIADTSIDEYAFAHCTELTSVKMVASTYLGGHIFDGCTKLQKVELNNAHSYVNEYAFANCTNLTGLTLPANMYMISQHMFENCTNLKQLTFVDTVNNPSNLKYCEASAFVNCPNLTSITLPRSVNGFHYLDPEFLKGSSVQQIQFNGISDDAMTTEYSKEVTTIVDCSVAQYNNLKTIINNAVKTHVPFIGLFSAGPKEHATNGSSCGRCNHWHEYVHNNVIKYAKDHNIPYLATENYNSALQGESRDLIEMMRSLFGLADSDTHKFVQVFLYWKKEDGTVVKWWSGSDRPTYDRGIDPNKNYYTQIFEPKLNSLFGGYHGTSTIEIKFKDELTTFGKDGTLTYISSSGNRYSCVNTTIEYRPKQRVDNISTADFKYGIWYGNAKQVKEFADNYHIPVIAEFSSAGCDPCIDFRKRTFDNQDFQSKIKEKKCLFVRIEIESQDNWTTPGTQSNFISHEWGDPKTLIPQIIYYWNKDGTHIIKNIENYNYRVDPAKATYDSLLTRIDSFINTYVPDSRFKQIPITEIEQNKCYRYDNQPNDNQAQFFINDKRTSVNEYSGIITIGSKTETKLIVGQTTTFSDGTYEYFTSSNNFYDKTGVLFKVSANKIDYIFLVENIVQNIQPNDIIEIDEDDVYKTGTLFKIDNSVGVQTTTHALDVIPSSMVGSAVFFVLDTSETSQAFKQNILQNDKFKQWVTAQRMYFMVCESSSSSDWNTQSLKKFSDFVTNIKNSGFPAFSITTKPAMLLFYGCNHCNAESTLETSLATSMPTTLTVDQYIQNLPIEFGDYWWRNILDV